MIVFSKSRMLRRVNRVDGLSGEAANAVVAQVCFFPRVIAFLRRSRNRRISYVPVF
jgi:hypothetical protein